MKTNKYVSDLIDVGNKKAVGHLPVETILYDGYSVEEIVSQLKDRNIKCKVYPPGNNNCDYVTAYDKNMLAALLFKYSYLLKKAGVPTSPAQFMSYIHSHTVDFLKHPQAFVAIGKCFNDKKFRKEFEWYK